VGEKTPSGVGGKFISKKAAGIEEKVQRRGLEVTIHKELCTKRKR